MPRAERFNLVWSRAQAPAVSKSVNAKIPSALRVSPPAKFPVLSLTLSSLDLPSRPQVELLRVCDAVGGMSWTYAHTGPSLRCRE